MGDSGRQEQYASERVVWDVEVAGANYWVVAEQASEALSKVEEAIDESFGHATIRQLSPRETVTARYATLADVRPEIRDWPTDSDEDEVEAGAPVTVTAYACEWAAAVPDLMLSTDW